MPVRPAAESDADYADARGDTDGLPKNSRIQITKRINHHVGLFIEQPTKPDIIYKMTPTLTRLCAVSARTHHRKLQNIQRKNK
jgi:hypothetical protein